MTNFRPIKTEPKEGKEFFGYWKNCHGYWRYGICFYIRKHTVDASPDRPPEECDVVGDQYFEPEGYRNYQSDNDEFYYECEPELWVPIEVPEK